MWLNFPFENISHIIDMFLFVKVKVKIPSHIINNEVSMFFYLHSTIKNWTFVSISLIFLTPYYKISTFYLTLSRDFDESIKRGNILLADLFQFSFSISSPTIKCYNHFFLHHSWQIFRHLLCYLHFSLFYSCFNRWLYEQLFLLELIIFSTNWNWQV